MIRKSTLLAVAIATIVADTSIADTRLQCQSPGPCKVLILNAEEEKVLTTQNGILDTATQARSLDLGALANYFKQKIATAPAGDEQKSAPASADPKAPNPSAKK